MIKDYQTVAFEFTLSVLEMLEDNSIAEELECDIYEYIKRHSDDIKTFVNHVHELEDHAGLSRTDFTSVLKVGENNS